MVDAKPKASFNDAAVEVPEDDWFGIAPFAEAIAKSFREMKEPVGTTVGLNGPWGSGKTSAVNLIRHYLGSEVEANRLGIIDFRCWWFRGEEALTLAFLQELRGALESTIGEKAKKLFGRLGKKLLQAGPIVGPAVNLATAGVLGSLAGGASDLASKLLSETESLEKVMGDLALALAGQSKRYLVVIDDIDRLTPEEALQVFKLIKSVGRLPNVMYLVVFDRDLAEKAVAARYPSEGPHFLEKIIQASFELPLPQRDDLYNAALREIQERCGTPAEGDMQRFWNVFYSSIGPYLSLPRHVARLANAMSVTWPAVNGEVDIADYVALEAIRLSDPALYSAVRASKDEVCGTDNNAPNGATLERLVAAASAGTRKHAEEALQRLFPRLEQVGYAGDFVARWDAKRLVCVDRHFDTYFRLTLGDAVLSAAAVDELVKRSADDGFVRTKFREALTITRRNGRSLAALLLQELNAHAREVSPGDVQPLVTTLFSIADEIDREEDDDRSSGFTVENHLRLHWLIRRLLRGRSLAERSVIYLSAAQGAPVGWLADFWSSAHRDHHPREGKEPEQEENCLVTREHLEPLRALLISKLQRAAADGTLLANRQLGSVLFRWLEASTDEGVELEAWVEGQLKNDRAVAALARAFTSESLSQGMGMFGLGDRVAKRTATAQVNGIDKFMDVKVFRDRLESIDAFSTSLDETAKAAVRVFLTAWRRQDAGRDEDDD